MENINIVNEYLHWNLQEYRMIAAAETSQTEYTEPLL